jgi:SAM-dependent methyltransferase
VSVAVSAERWARAQKAEQSYWDGLLADDREFLRVMLEKGNTANWLAKHLPRQLPDGDVVEIGIGPLAVGCMHFLPGRHDRTLVGVEPLPLIDPGDLGLSAPSAALVQACRARDYAHVRSEGEETGLETGRFAIAFCYNVLDHVRSPLAVLLEMHRILGPRGIIVLGVDTQSRLGLLRFKLFIEKQHANSIGVEAHPFRLRERDVTRLVQSAGFTVLHSNARRHRALRGLVSRAHRLMLICEKR